jgi:CelD/BcsL family acetyltransferase involved in cellulose biosynthesis
MTKDERQKLTAQIDEWPPNAAFAADWDSLLEQTSFASAFDHLEWIEIGISQFAKDAKILPCRFLDQEGTLACMGIFRITEESGKILPRTVVRTIEFNSQKIIPFIGADQQTTAEAIEALHDAINKPVDSFDFFKLDPQGGTLEKLSGFLDAKSLPHTLEVFNEQPYLPLVGTWVEYLSDRTQGHRKRIRRYTRKLWEKYPDYHFTRYQSKADFSEESFFSVMEKVLALFDASWQAEALAEENALEDLKSFYQQVATVFLEKGMLDLCTLHCDHTLIAFELNLVYRGSVHMLFGSYNRDYADWSPGNAILAEIIQDSYKKEYEKIEFGGEYLDYKKLWTKSMAPSYHLRVHGNTLRAKIKKIIDR